MAEIVRMREKIDWLMNTRKKMAAQAMKIKMAFYGKISNTSGGGFYSLVVWS